MEYKNWKILQCMNSYKIIKKEWDLNILTDLFNDTDRLLIQQIHLSSRHRQDSWYWILDNKGEFRVGSSYRRLRGEEICPDRLF